MTSDAVTERFASDVREHKVRVLHEDGIYRHLLCRSDSTFQYWFEIITTPGQLTIRGDMGTYVFARLTDMFEFFGDKPRINEQYWGEKLIASSSPIQRYSPKVAIQRAKEALKDTLEWKGLDSKQAAHVKRAFNEEVLADAADGVASEQSFREALDQFESYGVRLQDTWEWDLNEYDTRYLWNLHAIVWAIAKYVAGDVQR